MNKNHSNMFACQNSRQTSPPLEITKFLKNSEPNQSGLPYVVQRGMFETQVHQVDLHRQ